PALCRNSPHVLSLGQQPSQDEEAASMNGRLHSLATPVACVAPGPGVRLNDRMTEIADVPAAARAAVSALAGYTDLDWQQMRAAGLQWSCRQTALHMVDCLYFYAMQVIYGHPDDYLCTELALDDSASPPRLLTALSVHAELLHGIARSAGPDLRAHHNYGL